MRVTILPSSLAQPPSHLFTSYLINGNIAVDAGCLSVGLGIPEMSRIKHVFITHSHLDHVAALPPFLDAVYDGSGDCVVIAGKGHETYQIVGMARHHFDDVEVAIQAATTLGKAATEQPVVAARTRPRKRECVIVGAGRTLLQSRRAVNVTAAAHRR